MAQGGWEALKSSANIQIINSLEATPETLGLPRMHFRVAGERRCFKGREQRESCGQGRETRLPSSLEGRCWEAKPQKAVQLVTIPKTTERALLMKQGRRNGQASARGREGYS